MRAAKRASASAVLLMLPFLLVLTGCTFLSGPTVPPVESLAGATPVHPVRLRIPSIGVDTSLERLKMNRDGHLRPPRDPDRAGWFSGSAVPGDLGAAVVAGHRDSRTGRAVFWRLTDLRRGDRIRVTRSDGVTARFTVTHVRRVARARFPTARVYGATPGHELRLITCGGHYDDRHGHYRDNVLVLALAT